MGKESLSARIARQVAEQVGVEVLVEEHDGVITLTGWAEREELRRAAQEIAARLAPGRRIENEITTPALLPPDVQEFLMGHSSGELAVSLAAIEAEQGAADLELYDPDLFSPVPSEDLPLLTEPEPPTDLPLAESDDVYFPPTDPVVGLDIHGRVEVVGGFSPTAMEAVEVEPSSEDPLPGDEALADAIRRELRADALTTALNLEVRVRQGVVYLRGKVPGPEDADYAAEVASRVPGVAEVVDQTVVASE